MVASSPEADRQSGCFVHDPEAYPSTTSTATISCRRPLRPAKGFSTASSSIPTVGKLTSSHPSTSQTNPLLFEAAPSRLPQPEPHEDAIELVVRMPDGKREVFRLASSLSLQVGFSQGLGLTVMGAVIVLYFEISKGS